MTFDYEKLEKDLVEACEAVHKDFLQRFSSNEDYVSIGGAKLEAFINGLQSEFENAAISFLEKHNIEKDAEAKKRALAITKMYAKKCIEDFSKVTG